MSEFMILKTVEVGKRPNRVRMVQGDRVKAADIPKDVKPKDHPDIFAPVSGAADKGDDGDDGKSEGGGAAGSATK